MNFSLIALGAEAGFVDGILDVFGAGHPDGMQTILYACPKVMPKSLD